MLTDHLHILYSITLTAIPVLLKVAYDFVRKGKGAA
jgi:hypothetical protein